MTIHRNLIRSIRTKQVVFGGQELNLGIEETDEFLPMIVKSSTHPVFELVTNSFLQNLRFSEAADEEKIMRVDEILMVQNSSYVIFYGFASRFEQRHHQMGLEPQHALRRPFDLFVVELLDGTFDLGKQNTRHDYFSPIPTPNIASCCLPSTDSVCTSDLRLKQVL